MYALHTIQKINAQAAAAPKSETETTRHCSYCGDADTGVVLHSARQRSTAFLSPGDKARQFLVGWFSSNSATKRDELVEAYFNTIPTGKQVLV